jgi:hypothetical protein
MWAQIVAGRIDDLEKLDWRAPIIHYLIQGNQAGAQQLAEQRWADPNITVGQSLNIAAMVGDRARANEFAARIDKYPGSARFLVGSLGWCRDLAGVVKASGCRHGVPFPHRRIGPAMAAGYIPKIRRLKLGEHPFGYLSMHFDDRLWP